MKIVGNGPVDLKEFPLLLSVIFLAFKCEGSENTHGDYNGLKSVFDPVLFKNVQKCSHDSDC